MVKLPLAIAVHSAPRFIPYRLGERTPLQLVPRLLGQRKSEIYVKIDCPIEQTSWLALRGYGNRAVQFLLANSFHVSTVHSAPIYVTVKNMPPLTSQPAARVAARSWLAQLENLELRPSEENLQYFFELIERNKNSGDGISKELVSRDRTALLEEIAHAKEFFMKFVE